MLVEFCDVVKKYGSGDGTLLAVDHISFSIDEGEFVVILGQSGAGKSTVLNILGGMDQPTEGTVRVAGREISAMKDKALGAYRADVIVLELLQKLCREQGKTVVLVTHNADIAKCADKVIRMKNGKIREVQRNPRPMAVREGFTISYNGVTFTRRVKGLIESPGYEFRQAEGDADVYIENIAFVYMSYSSSRGKNHTHCTRIFRKKCKLVQDTFFQNRIIWGDI